MKKWLRNLASGLGLAAVAAACVYVKYKEYQQPTVISVKYDQKTGERVIIYQPKKNILFETLNKHFGIFKNDCASKKSYISNPSFGLKRNVCMYNAATETEDRAIVNYWKKAERNSRLLKKEPKWVLNY